MIALVHQYAIADGHAETLVPFRENQIERVVIEWPSGTSEEHKKLSAGKCYEVTETKEIKEFYAF